jgi:ribonuclease HI
VEEKLLEWGISTQDNPTIQGEGRGKLTHYITNKKLVDRLAAQEIHHIKQLVNGIRFKALEDINRGRENPVLRRDYQKVKDALGEADRVLPIIAAAAGLELPAEGYSRQPITEAWTDGSAQSEMRDTAKYGVWIDEENHLNGCWRVSGTTVNNVAELQAILHLMVVAGLAGPLQIYTDSEYSINAMQKRTQRIRGRMTKSVGIEVEYLIDEMQTRREVAGLRTELHHVNSHLLEGPESQVKQQKRRRMELLYGDDTERILEGNQLADAEAGGEPRRSMTIPMFCPADGKKVFVWKSGVKARKQGAQKGDKIFSPATVVRNALLRQREEKLKKAKPHMMDENTHAKHSNHVIYSKNKKHSKIARYLIKERLCEYNPKAMVYDRLHSPNQKTREYFEKAYKWRPMDRLCDLCGEEELHHHAIFTCKEMDAERDSLPDRILNIVSQYCDVPPLELPIFYHTNVTITDRPHSEWWVEVASFDRNLGSMGYIPKALVTFMKQVVNFNLGTNIDQVLEEIHFELATTAHKIQVAWYEKKSRRQASRT